MANNIQDAIHHYNRQKGVADKMTQRRVALYVLQDKDITEHAKYELVSMWVTEQRQPRIDHIRRMCEFLEVDANYLIGLTDEYTFKQHSNREEGECKA